MHKYELIRTYLTTNISDGTWPVGTKLPSIRQLSTQFNCSKDTVLRVFTELKYQNLIYSINKSGHYVLTGLTNSTIPVDPPMNFANSMPDKTLFPYNDFRACLNQATSTTSANLFTYFTDAVGYPPLINSVKNYFVDNHIFPRTNEIVITSGIQQALYILTQMPFPNGKATILLEQPTYHQMNRLVSQVSNDFLTINRSKDGLNFNELEQIFKNHSIKFFYTVPRFSIPFGNSYTQKERQRLINLAVKYDVYLVEDDYFADFDNSPRNRTIYEDDLSNHIIYLRSFSKIMFPALRIGAALLPQPLASRFIEEKRLIDYDTNLFMQQALAIYLASSMFQRHRILLQNAYQEKALILNNFLYSHGIKKNSLATQLVLSFDYTKITPSMLAQLLKQHQLEVNFLEQNYLKSVPYGQFSIDVRNIPTKSIKPYLSQLWVVIAPFLLV